ncbi:MAG: element excision factor XisH family protein [Planctomycetaceae bacterium]
MPARDAIHDTVRNALVKDGWTITDDPYILEYEDLVVYPDLGADRSLGAERGSERMVIEVKSFLGRSSIYELEHAIGQYLIYRILLSIRDPNCRLFMAVARDIHEEVFGNNAVRLIVAELAIRLLVIDPKHEEVVEWIE